MRDGCRIAGKIGAHTIFWRMIRVSKKKQKLNDVDEESSHNVKQKIHLGFYEIGDRVSGIIHDLDRDIYSHKDMDAERRQNF